MNDVSQGGRMKDRPTLRRSTSYGNLKELFTPEKPQHLEEVRLKEKFWKEIGKPLVKNPRGSNIIISREFADHLKDVIRYRLSQPETVLSVSLELVFLYIEELERTIKKIEDAEKAGGKPITEITLSAELAGRIWDELGPELKYRGNDLRHFSLAENITPEMAEIITEEIGPHRQYITDKYFVPDPRNPRKVTIIATGCGGDVGEGQTAVADAMERFMAKNRHLNVRYVVNCGDNFYDAGVDSPTHPDFDTKFYNVYFNPKYRYLRHLRFLMTLGNHDGNRRKVEYYMGVMRRIVGEFVSISGPACGKDAEKNQVMRRHFEDQDPTKPETFSTRDAYQQARIDMSDLGMFDMSYYHTSRVMHDKFQYFFVNSNSLLQDLLAYLADDTGIIEMTPEEKEKNQVYRLLADFQKCKEDGFIPLLVMHNPLLALGKRWWPKEYDSNLYNYFDEITRLDLILQLSRENKTEYRKKVMEILKAKKEKVYSCFKDVPYPTVDAANYSLMLTRFFAAFNLDFNLVICAHDHLLAYQCVDGVKGVSQNYDPDDKNKTPIPPKQPRPDDVSEYKIRQITTGGGGGKLQSCEVFSPNGSVGSCLVDNGFIAYTLDQDNPDLIDIHVVTVKHTELMIEKDKRRPWEDDLYLRFDTRSAKPIREPIKKIDPKDKAAIEDQMKVNAFTEQVLDACRQYEKFLSEKTVETKGEFFDKVHTSWTAWKSANFTHKREDVVILNKMIAYLSQDKRTSYAETVDEVYQLCELLKNKTSPNALLRKINENLKANQFLGHKNLEKLHNAVIHPQPTKAKRHGKH
jgi:hypothetical protein